MKPKLAPHERIIAAWDRSTFTIEDQRKLAQLIPHIGGIKVGYQALCTPVEPDSSVMVGHALRVHVRHMHGPDVRIMYDAKFLDIEHTMLMAAEALRGAVWGFTVHACARKESLRRCIEAAGSTNPIGVTVLTDHDDADCEETFDAGTVDMVLCFAERFARAGGKMLVCSGRELEYLDTIKLVKITPGVRLPGSDHQDQKRVVSPGKAVSLGADFVVCGRDIFGSHDWVGNAKRIAENIAG